MTTHTHDRLATYELVGSIVPTEVTPAYRAGLLVVALAMLVLPFVYLGIIAAAARVVWWHLTANAWILTGRGGGIWKIAGYFGPAIAGSAVVFFMIKPILARPARGVEPMPLDPAQHPRLWTFIRGICDQVGARQPARIQVDCQVNASASFARAPWSVGQPDLVLTIGLPLAAGLSIREFAGVLAHEFGHFAQTGGMRLTFIVRSINRWLARVAHERDQWDESLEEWANSETTALLVTFQLAKAAVWISRSILDLLMRAGHVISSFMLRQMEYDADSYEVKVVGTETFLATSARLRELNVAAQVTYADLQNAWARRRLPANLPSFVLHHCGRLPENIVTQIRQLPAARTSAFDTHPSDADRARAAEALASAGIFLGGDQSAAALFHDFEALAVAASRHHYTHDLGLDLDATTLVDGAAAIAATRERERWSSATASLYGDTLSLVRPITAPWPAPVMALDDAAVGLRDAAAAMERDRDTAAANVKRFEEYAATGHLADTAMQLLQAGFTQIVPEEFRLSSSSADDAPAAERAAVRSQQALEPELQRFERLAADRIACALAILTDRRGIPPGQRAELLQEAQLIVPPLNALADTWPAISDLHHILMVRELIELNAPKSPDQSAVLRQTSRLVARAHEHLARIREKLGSVPGPDPLVPATVATMLGFSEGNDEPPEPATVLSAAIALRSDLVGRLASMVLVVEEKMSGASTART